MSMQVMKLFLKDMIMDHKTEFFINIKTKENIIIFQKNSRGFEVLNVDRLNNLLTN